MQPHIHAHSKIDFSPSHFLPALIVFTARDVFYQPNESVHLLLQQCHPFLSPALRERMQTALHEALMNAVLHGAFELRSDYANSAQFFQFASHANVLADGALGGREIRLHYHHDHRAAQHHWDITHQGIACTTPQFATEKLVPFGRGLQWIATLSDAVVWKNNGFTLHMMFVDAE